MFFLHVMQLPFGDLLLSNAYLLYSWIASLVVAKMSCSLMDTNYGNEKDIVEWDEWIKKKYEKLKLQTFNEVTHIVNEWSKNVNHKWITSLFSNLYSPHDATNLWNLRVQISQSFEYDMIYEPHLFWHGHSNVCWLTKTTYVIEINQRVKWKTTYQIKLNQIKSKWVQQLLVDVVHCIK